MPLLDYYIIANGITEKIIFELWNSNQNIRPVASIFLTFSVA